MLTVCVLVAEQAPDVVKVIVYVPTVLPVTVI